MKANFGNIFLYLFKYLPVLFNVVLIELIFEYFSEMSFLSNYAYDFTGHSVLVMIMWYFGSLKFRFCLWHRILILNLIISELLEFISNFENVDFIYYLITYSTSVSVLTVLVLLSWQKISNVKKKHI